MNLVDHHRPDGGRFKRSLFPVSMTCSVSGVVISRSGGFSDCFLLSLWLVSP